MFRQVVLTCFLLVSLILFQSASAGAQAIGSVVSVVPGGEIRTAAGRTKLVEGAALSNGDIITTDASGRAQLLFSDGTKIAVGPGSRLVIDEVLMQSGGTAQRFAVNAVGGTFRFISGKSAKPAYKISTPTATMGIRGTLFDFSVDKNRGTNMVLFRGQVNLCAQGNCAEVRGRCTMAVSDRKGNIGGIGTRQEKLGILASEFPFVTDQNDLSKGFQAPVRSCGDLSRIAKKPIRAAVINEEKTGNREPPQRSEPERADPPAPEPEPEPEPPPSRG